mmetsp:Transcript_44767/g.129479  ORF Transcript_44767/g.129479 Transcript_44767/m.129479 type:complete len:299 (-) Transcript_44767:187-1083(-)
MRPVAGPAPGFCDDAKRRAVLTKAAGALAKRLADPSLPSEDGLDVLLKAVLLAECEDAGNAAAARCEVLRADLAAALRQALAPLPSAAHFLTDCCRGDGSFAPCVRVEVRGTAGRTITKGCFTIGSDPYCDVQAFGDATVMPLQCLVVPLPGGTVIIDIWSGGGTCAAWRGTTGDPGLSTLKTGPCTALVARHNERIAFRIGAQTTITLGPRLKKVAKAARPVAAKTVVRPGLKAEKVALAPRECKPAAASQISTFSTACVSSSSSSSTSSSSSSLSSRSRSRSRRRITAGRPIAVRT